MISNQQKTLSENERLLHGIATGDPKVLREIYSKYFDSITKYILNNSGTIDDAKDIFQDGLMIIYEKLKQTDFKLQHSLHTYLFSVCRNIWLKKLRKNTGKRVSLPDNLELTVEDSFEEEILWREKERLFREKFKELSEGCRKVLQLQLSGISMEEIAQKMGFSSAGYAKKRKYKCKNQLLNLIQNDARFRNLQSYG